MFEIDEFVCSDKEVSCRDTGDSSLSYVPCSNFPNILEDVNNHCQESEEHSKDKTNSATYINNASGRNQHLSPKSGSNTKQLFKSEKASDSDSDDNPSTLLNSSKNIKEEVSASEATEDESMAVEALWQLGGGVYNESDVKHSENSMKLDSEGSPSRESPLPIITSSYSLNRCESCEQSFVSLDDLNIHNATCEKRLKNIYTCTICSETFEKKLNFNNHMICHQVARPYSCRPCGSLFKLKADLQNHTCLQAVRNFYCHICGVEFSRSSSLTNHMKVHSYVPGRALMAAAIASGDPEVVTTTGPSQWTSPECQILPPLLPQLDLQPAIFFNQIESNQSEISNWNMNINDHLSSESLPDSMDIAQEMTVNTTYSNDLDSQSSEFQDEFEQLDAVSVSTDCDYSLLPDKKNSPSEPKHNYAMPPPITSVKVETLPYLRASLDSNPTDTVIHTDLAKDESVEKKKPHICRTCGVGFTRAKALISHERLHEDYWSDCFECQKCGDIFANNQAFKTHVCNSHLHQPEVNTIVKTSNRVINKDRNITVTNSIVNEDDLELDDYLAEDDIEESPLDSSKTKQSKHTCLQCAKKFTTKQKMFRHMWIHRKKTFCCEVCSETFTLQTQLDEHRLSMHPSNTPHGCTFCGKCFASRQGLWEHARAHREGAAPHRCPICPKRFASRQGFLIHSRTHTGERPYGCRYCWKAFRDGGTLRKHERIHTGERPHTCPLCMRAFNQKVVLREHVRWVHAATESGGTDELHFPCPLCPQVLTDREDLCAHIVKHSDILAARDKQKGTEPLTETKQKPPTPKLSVKKDIFPNISANKKKEYNVYTSSFSLSESFPPVDPLENETVEIPCDMCGDVFDSKESLLIHIRVHI